MKAIETVYNGYKFRSRLEARWAVFFDALDVKYEYEPEGFELDDGTKYLPDFYLPEEEYYIEVKGRNDHLDKDVAKMVKFVEQKKTAVMILTEIPYDKESNGLYWFPIITYTSKKCRFVLQHALFEKYDGVPAIIQDDFQLGCRAHWSPFNVRCHNNPKLMYDEIQPILGKDLDDNICYLKGLEEILPIEKALLKARQARFEHGEMP